MSLKKNYKRLKVEKLSVTGEASGVSNVAWKPDNTVEASGQSEIRYDFQNGGSTTYMLVFKDVSAGTGGGSGQDMRMRFNNDDTVSYDSFMRDGTRSTNNSYWKLHGYDTQPLTGVLYVNAGGSISVTSELGARYNRNMMQYGCTSNELPSSISSGDFLNIFNIKNNWGSGKIEGYYL